MNQQKQECLSVKELVKCYGGRNVVNGLNFFVNQGEVVGLLGPNGAGKTTAFYMTVGLISPDKGQVIFNGEDVTYQPMHKRARMGMGYLAQEPSIFRNLTVRQNLQCVLECIHLTPQERQNKEELLLDELNLRRLADKKAVSLSGGERRRLEIARALATEPTFLLLDEPFANIDPISVQEVKEMIGHLVSKDIGILITDHNAREIFSVVDRSYLVQEGKVLKAGTVDELVGDPEVRRAYLGEHFHL